VHRKSAIAVAIFLLLGAYIAPGAGAMNLSRLIAPASVCGNQTNLNAPSAAQERAMRCMTDFARRRAGMGGLVDARSLDRSALDKATDILRCDSFSHEACGRGFTFWMRRVSYVPAPCWRVGENLAWGTGGYATVRSIFRAWIHSPEHRANIIGRYTQLGIGLRVGALAGDQEVHVWTQHFGSHCHQAAKPVVHRRRLSRAIAVAPAAG
jgi:uncharacterized protein YkwD